MGRREADKPIRFVKAWTRYAEDPAFYSLSWAERGIWWQLLLWQSNASDAPGKLILNDRPMTLDDICIGLRCVTPADRRLVTEAIATFVGRRLLTHGELEERTGVDGWRIARWDEEQASYNRESAEQSKARVQRWRANQRAQRLESDGVTPLRKRR